MLLRPACYGQSACKYHGWHCLGLYSKYSKAMEINDANIDE